MSVRLKLALTIFADRLSKDAGKDPGAVTVVKEFDQSLPEIPCYPGDLNQVWTNIIDNAIAAMRDKGGTLTIRTCREGESMARVVGYHEGDTATHEVWDAHQACTRL